MSRRTLLGRWVSIPLGKVLLLAALTASLGIHPFGTGLNAQSSIWTTAYYAGWMQGYNNSGHLPAQNIDYSAVTHIVHFAFVPRSDGTLDLDANGMTQTNSTELVTRAHAAGRQAVFCVGGWGSDGGFRGATSAANRALFITNLITVLVSRGYDGVDIDWEPLQSSDAAQFTTFIGELRTALNAISPRPLLTAAVSWQPGILAQVHQHFDQINIMTYDMSGPWPGWVTWHNAAIYDGGYRFPSTGEFVPSTDSYVNRFVAAGIPASKLGIGIDFYGYVWSGGDGTPTGGATEPRQSWTVAPTRSFEQPYHTIMQNHYQPGYYRWDDAAQAAYLKIDNAGSSDDKFISYDDETTCQSKIRYARTKGIGGVIIWELGGGYRPNMPAGQRDLLLQAVKQAATGVSDLKEVPTMFELSQNYPNPFNPSTVIKYALPQSAAVTLEVFNILGQRVALLVNSHQTAGAHETHFHAAGLASGVYFYRLTATSRQTSSGVESGQNLFVETRKMSLMK